MASVSVGGSGTFVSAPVLGDQAGPGVPIPGQAEVFADPNQSLPQASVNGGVTSVGNGYVALAIHPEQGNQGVQIRVGDSDGEMLNQFLTPSALPVFADPNPDLPQAGVFLPTGQFVAVALHPEEGNQGLQVRGSADGTSVTSVFLTPNSVPVYADPMADVPQAGIAIPDGPFVGVAVHPEEGNQGVHVIADDGNGQTVNQFVSPTNLPVFVDPNTSVPQAYVALPDGPYVAAAYNQPNGVIQVRGGSGATELFNEKIPVPMGGAGGDFPPSDFPPSELPSFPPEGLPAFPPAFASGSGADTVVAPGAVASAIDMGGASLLGAGALSNVDTFAAAVGGGLVNLGADSLASSQLAGAFVQDPALQQFVAPVIETQTAAPATGSVLSLDDGLTTIQFHNLDRHR